MLKFISFRFIKFLIIGGFNTLFGFVIYSILAMTLLPTWLVLLLATLFGIIFNFFTTGGLVFKNLSIAKVPAFFICYAVIFFLNLGFLYLLTPLIGNRILAMATIIIPMAILTYFLQARLVWIS